MTDTPRRVLVDGWPAWRMPDGRLFPIVRGGEGEEPTPGPAAPAPAPASPPPAPAQPPDPAATAATLKAEIDKAVKAARAEERSAIAKDLGVEKLEAAKAVLEAQRTAEAAKLSDAERREQAAAEREAAAEARESAASARERSGAITAALVSAGAPAANVGDLVALVSLPADATDLDEAATTAVASVKEKFPALFAAVGVAPSGVPGNQPGQPSAVDDLAEARARGTTWRAEHSTTADPLAGFRRVGAPQ